MLNGQKRKRNGMWVYLMAHCINEALMESLNTHTHKEEDTLLLAYMEIEATIT